MDDARVGTERHWLRTFLSRLAKRLRDESMEVHRQLIEESQTQHRRETLAGLQLDERVRNLEGRVKEIEEAFELIYEIAVEGD